jgi:hypothetical protein
VETDLLQTIWRLVGEETMSSTRIFMEWALSRLYLQFPSLITDDFMSTRVLYRDVSASLVVSMIAIFLNMVKKLNVVDEEMMLKVFLPIISDHILPLLVHNNHAVRMHAIHAFKQLEYQKRKYGVGRYVKIYCTRHLIYNIFSTVLGYKLLAGFIEDADHCQKFIKKLDSDAFVSPNGLDPIDDFTLDWIFGRLMKLGGVDGEAIEFVI